MGGVAKRGGKGEGGRRVSQMVCVWGFLEVGCRVWGVGWRRGGEGVRGRVGKKRNVAWKGAPRKRATLL